MTIYAMKDFKTQMSNIDLLHSFVEYILHLILWKLSELVGQSVRTYGKKKKKKKKLETHTNLKKLRQYIIERDLFSQKILRLETKDMNKEIIDENVAEIEDIL